MPRPPGPSRCRRVATTCLVLVALVGAFSCAPTSGPDGVAELLALDAAGRSIVVVLSDTHRLDHVSGLVEAPGARTPNLERLLDRGVGFADALTPVPISAPAYATLMTGLAPLEHGLLNNEQHLASDLPLLQERLRGAGYRTAAVVGNPYCSSGHGFGRGFDAFWDRIDGRGNHGEVITDEALRWLETVDDGDPIFLFLAYMDAHTPYVADGIPPSLRVELNGEHLLDARAENAHVEQRYPVTLQPGRNRIVLRFLDDGEAAAPGSGASPLHVRKLRLASGRDFAGATGLTEVPGTGFFQLANRTDLVVVNPDDQATPDELVFRCYRKYRHENVPKFYRAGVRSFDRSFGRLLDALDAHPATADATVIFVSDHGEMLGEHGAWGHVRHVHQESLKIPLVVAAPGLDGGRIDSARLGLRDLHDLILELAIGPDADRRRAIDERATRPFVAATYPPEGGSLKVAVIDKGLKAVVTADGDEHVFDLDSDPGERHDLLTGDAVPAGAEPLLAAARAELARAAAAELLDLDTLSPEERDRLHALGYLEPAR